MQLNGEKLLLELIDELLPLDLLELLLLLDCALLELLEELFGWQHEQGKLNVVSGNVGSVGIDYAFQVAAWTLLGEGGG